MKIPIIYCVVLVLCACAPRPRIEYEYVLHDGTPASSSEVTEAKAECEYDAKMREADNYYSKALSVAASESRYVKTQSKAFNMAAGELILEFYRCLHDHGLQKREKVQP